MLLQTNLTQFFPAGHLAENQDTDDGSIRAKHEDEQGNG